MSRKYIRIALTPEDEVALSNAKKYAEAKTGISMSDSMFALSVIRHRVKAWAATNRAKALNPKEEPKT